MAETSKCIDLLWNDLFSPFLSWDKFLTESVNFSFFFLFKQDSFPLRGCSLGSFGAFPTGGYTDVASSQAVSFGEDFSLLQAEGGSGSDGSSIRSSGETIGRGNNRRSVTGWYSVVMVYTFLPTKIGFICVTTIGAFFIGSKIRTPSEECFLGGVIVRVGFSSKTNLQISHLKWLC